MSVDGWGYGNMLSLASAVLWALYIVRLDVSSPRHGPIPLTTYQMLAATVLALCALPFMQRSGMEITQGLIWSLVYCGLLSSGITTLLQMKFQPMSTPVKASLIYTAQPVFAAIFAKFFLGETLTTLGWTGAGLILSGVVVSEVLNYDR